MSIFNNNYKRQGKIGLFDNQEASERLSKMVDKAVEMKGISQLDIDNWLNDENQ